MFVDLQNKYDWVLQPVVGYPSVDRLIEVLEDKVVRPAEAKFNELLARIARRSAVRSVSHRQDGRDGVPGRTRTCNLRIRNPNGCPTS